MPRHRYFYGALAVMMAAVGARAAASLLAHPAPAVFWIEVVMTAGVLLSLFGIALAWLQAERRWKRIDAKTAGL